MDRATNERPEQAHAELSTALEGRATDANGDLLAMVEELGLPEASSGGMLPSTALAELRAAGGS
jgi:hypothetical protein